MFRCQEEFQKDYMDDLDRQQYVDNLDKAETEEEKNDGYKICIISVYKYFVCWNGKIFLQIFNFLFIFLTNIIIEWLLQIYF